MPCTRITLKRYRSRPSPPYHANDCPGQTKKGNDGKLYKSIADGSGIYTWRRMIRVGKTLKQYTTTVRYETHDNGARPFIAEVDEGKRQLDLFKATPERPLYLGLYRYKQIWLGSDPHKMGDKPKSPKGNSILIHLQGTGRQPFLFIGHKVFEFDLQEGDSPVEYISYVGRSDVPYPYLVGKTHTYFMLDGTYVANEHLDLKKDAYSQLYSGALEGKMKKFRSRARST